MAMTKKDFVVIAQHIARSRKAVTSDELPAWQKSTAFVMAALFAVNPRMSPDLFMNAIGADATDRAQIIAIYRLVGGG